MRLKKRPAEIRVVELTHGDTTFELLVSERRQRGMSYREIARELGISHQTVWRYRGEASVPELAGSTQ